MLDPGPEPALAEAPPRQLRRLTSEQYRNSIQDLFGDDLVLPGSLEPDEEVDLLLSVGSSVTAVSPRGVEHP